MPSAEALAVQSDGHIIAVGGSADMLSLQQPATQITDLHGACVMPVSHRNSRLTTPRMVQISTHRAVLTCIPASAAALTIKAQLGRQPVTVYLCVTTWMQSVLVGLCTVLIDAHTLLYSHSICCCLDKTMHSQETKVMIFLYETTCMLSVLTGLSTGPY